MKRLTLGFATLLAVSALHADDWPMFGGRPDRNMVSPEKGLPTKWAKDGKDVLKWKVDLGTQALGNPVVAGGRLFIGTDNGKPRYAAERIDKSAFLCLSEKDGSLLWEGFHAFLPDRAEDFPCGICSTPCVAGSRVYYVSNRAELVCADVEGFADGENDGPFTGETRKGVHDMDIVWILDMRKEFGVVLDQACASSPVVVDGRVFVLTGQSKGLGAEKVTNPGTASFIAVDAATGALLRKDASPGEAIMEGQWGSPAHATVDGSPQVCFPGGDGWLYAFEPATGKLLWKFDGKRHQTSKPVEKKDFNYFVAAPVYAGHRLIVAVGQNPENSSGEGALYALDARKRGDLTSGGLLWSQEGKEFGRTVSSVAVHEGLVYAVELAGYLNCFELETGKLVWKHDLLSTVWGSPLVADGKVFVQTGDGEIHVFQVGREKKLLATNSLKILSHGSVLAANGTLYVNGSKTLYALKASP